MRTPVVLVTGVDSDFMQRAMVGVQLDLPRAVVVRHHIDVAEQVLLRVVSDVTGVIDRAEIALEHACVSCALREDIIPTIERVARGGRWTSVIALLPSGAEARQVCHVLTQDTRLARHLRVASVVTALSGETLVDDLLGDALLAERNQHTSYDDLRGVGEVASAMVEYADVVVLGSDAGPAGRDLVRTLARPDADVVAEVTELDGSSLCATRHQHGRTLAWSAPYRPAPAPEAASGRVWTLALESPGAFHPGRLLDRLDELGGGRHRSRGCFWLPTRPHQALVWDGSGGQLSIGRGEPWGRRTALTRLDLTGVGPVPDGLSTSFDEILLRPEESRSHDWYTVEDGFEPWLGPIRDVA
ncbi:GTP-binding protein [Nocardioides sp.]|uniref:CobW family GTP-binding protein n=1 Tax=Nocardioides sp. TaxID=35761 RepID=UPI002736BB39|nr:GTP-binding protein [Nocardioides sp.]MDP3893076.1 GTP-binding protein [Nocardioides sp.]